jgi:hypothetical protein
MRSRRSNASSPVPASKALESLGLEHPGQRPPDPGLVIYDEAIGEPATTGCASRALGMVDRLL